MRRRNTQRAGRTTVLGTAADSVEVRILLSADPAMSIADAVPEDLPVEAQQPSDDAVVEGQAECQPAETEAEFQPEVELAVVEQPWDPQQDGGSLVTIAECGLVPEDNEVSSQLPQVVICEPYDPRLMPEGYEWQTGWYAGESGEEQSAEAVQVEAFGLTYSEGVEFPATEQFQGLETENQQEPWLTAAGTEMVNATPVGRMAQFVQISNPVALVSGAVTAEFELASSPEYDEAGNPTVPAVLHDRLSGIRYWQPKQLTLQSATDLTEMLQNYGITDYTVDDQGVWQIPVSGEYGVELFNLATWLLADQTVRADLWLQPVDGQDAVPLLISLPECQVSVNYESSWTAPEWQNSAVQIYASGAFNGTLELAEGPLWDEAGQLISAGVLVDVATGLRYQSPQVLTVSGESIDQLDLLLQDSVWAAGLDTKIISVEVLDAQTRQLQIAPGTGYDVLQLAGQLTNQTGLGCVVRLAATDKGGEDLEIRTPDTTLSVVYPVYMYARGSVNSGTPEVQFGEVLTAVVDGPVRPDVLQMTGFPVMMADGVDVPVFAFGSAATQPELSTEPPVLRTMIDQIWMAPARQPISELPREVATVSAADNELSRLSAIAAAVPVSSGRMVSETAAKSTETDAASELNFESLNLSIEVSVQPSETVPDLNLLNPALRKRQPRPVPQQPQQEDAPVDLPVEQPAVPADPQSETPAAQLGPNEIPVSQSEPAIDSLMATFAATGVTH